MMITPHHSQIYLYTNIDLHKVTLIYENCEQICILKILTLQKSFIKLILVSDDMRWHRSGSILAQVMACSLMAPYQSCIQTLSPLVEPEVITRTTSNTTSVNTVGIMTIHVFNVPHGITLYFINKYTDKMVDIFGDVIIFKFIFCYKTCCILICNSLQFVHSGQITNKPALVQVKAWHQTGEKPLSEPKMAYKHWIT